jgi:hypothetical protein
VRLIVVRPLVVRLIVVRPFVVPLVVRPFVVRRVHHRHLASSLSVSHLGPCASLNVGSSDLDVNPRRENSRGPSRSAVSGER